MSEPLLRVRDLRVEFQLARGTLRAVDGVSFDVHPGEALGLVGESGSGKTVALRALVGLLPRAARITGGTVEIDGVDVTAASEDRRRELRGTTVSMIFQEPMTALNPVMRVGEQIAEAPLVRLGQSRREAKQRALELMRLVGIPDPARRAEAYPHELSGGMRQRVMIAIALSGDPRLILCDEPTTALDVTIQDQILKLLQQLQRELDVALVFVSHDLAVVAQTSPAGRRDVRGPDRRDGRRGGRLPRAAASVHARPAALGARLRRGARDALLDSGRAARSRVAAARLPLPPALPVRADGLPRGRDPAARARRASAPPGACITTRSRSTCGASR